MTPDQPLPLRLWVTQRQTGAFGVDGLAQAWTDRQVEVLYADPHGRIGTVWVWATAVTRRVATTAVGLDR